MGDAQGVDNPAEEGVAHRDAGSAAGPADDAALADLFRITEEDAADPVGGQVLDHAFDAV